jgi:hypothetical protein
VGDATLMTPQPSRETAADSCRDLGGCSRKHGEEGQGRRCWRRLSKAEQSRYESWVDAHLLARTAAFPRIDRDLDPVLRADGVSGGEEKECSFGDAQSSQDSQ